MFWFSRTAHSARTCESVGVSPLFACDESIEVFDHHAHSVDFLVDHCVEVLPRELFLLQHHDLELRLPEAADERVEGGFVRAIRGPVFLVREQLVGLLTRCVP